MTHLSDAEQTQRVCGFDADDREEPQKYRSNCNRVFEAGNATDSKESPGSSRPQTQVSISEDWQTSDAADGGSTRAKGVGNFLLQCDEAKR